MGCRISLKMHVLHSHLDTFPMNVSDVRDEHGERFHKDISEMEERYKGKWNLAMMSVYYWTLKRDSEGHVHKRKGRKMHF